LREVLDELAPRELAIPDTVLALFNPRFDAGNVELVGSRTRPAFDELSAARSLAQLIVDGLLQRERTARLVAFAPRAPNLPSLGEVIDALVASTWGQPADANAKYAALQRVAQRAVADGMMTLAADKQAAPEVRAIIDLKLAALQGQAQRIAAATEQAETKAHALSAAADIKRWLERGELPSPTPAPRTPPGDPFGDGWPEAILP
jgi:hypothetical protein